MWYEVETYEECECWISVVVVGVCRKACGHRYMWMLCTHVGERVCLWVYCRCRVWMGVWVKAAAPDGGLEPPTLRLKVWCSTDWANRARPATIIFHPHQIKLTIHASQTLTIYLSINQTTKQLHPYSPHTQPHNINTPHSHPTSTSLLLFLHVFVYLRPTTSLCLYTYLTVTEHSIPMHNFSAIDSICFTT